MNVSMRSIADMLGISPGIYRFMANDWPDTYEELTLRFKNARIKDQRIAQQIWHLNPHNGDWTGCLVKGLNVLLLQQLGLKNIPTTKSVGYVLVKAALALSRTCDDFKIDNNILYMRWANRVFSNHPYASSLNLLGIENLFDTFSRDGTRDFHVCEMVMRVTFRLDDVLFGLGQDGAELDFIAFYQRWHHYMMDPDWNRDIITAALTDFSPYIRIPKKGIPSTAPRTVFRWVLSENLRRLFGVSFNPSPEVYSDFYLLDQLRKVLGLESVKFFDPIEENDLTIAYLAVVAMEEAKKEHGDALSPAQRELIRQLHLVMRIEE